MKRVIKLLLAAGMIMSVLSASASLTIEECQQSAAENYPLVKRYALIEQTEGYTLSNLSKGYLPQISIDAQATYQSDAMALPEALTRILAANGYDSKGLAKDQYKIGVSVNQLIYDGGRIRAARETAAAENEAQAKKNNADLYQLKERVNNLFFGVLLAQEKIRINEDMQTLLKDNCRKVEAMVKGGVAMKSDCDVIRAEYLSVCQQHTELVSIRDSYLRMLEIFIGKRIDGELVKPEASSVLVDDASSRPELQYLDAQARVLDSRKKQLDAALRPYVGLFAQGYYGYPGYNTFEDMYSRDWSINGIVGLKVSWNLSSFYTHKNDKQKLALSHSEIENAREVFLFNNRLQYTENNAAIERYGKVMAEDKEIINLRTSVRRAAEEKLAHGVIDTNNLLQEINRENNAKTALSTHEVEMLKSFYDQRYTLNK